VIVIGRDILVLLLLVFIGSLLSFSSSVRAQGCTPVVYVFRHAEEEDAPANGLTDVGQRHAFLYPEMLAAFGAANNYCPVAFVYATSKTKPTGFDGSFNPYETAQPTAIAACYNFPNVSSQSLATCNFFPRTTLENGGKLYEYLGEDKAEQGTPPGGRSATSSEFQDELTDKIQTEGVSIAIFWTSQGLNILGQALVPGFTGIPGCTAAPAQGACEKLKAPRNTAYVFEFNGSDFAKPNKLLQYVQCFNVHVDFADSQKIVGPAGTVYYCGNGADNTGSLPDITEKKDLDALQGKICDTGSLTSFDPTHYFGTCR
jgi:hypothetical protein